MQLVIRRCRMEGFIVIDYMDRAAEAAKDLSAWIASGQIKHGEDIQEGIVIQTGCYKCSTAPFEQHPDRNVAIQLPSIQNPTAHASHSGCDCP